MTLGKEHRGTATKRRRLDSDAQLLPCVVVSHTTPHLDDSNLNRYTNESSLSYIQDRLGMCFLDTGSNTLIGYYLPRLLLQSTNLTLCVGFKRI